MKEEKDKRYLLFKYEDYYPLGGMSDFSDSFDTIEEAKEFMDKNPYWTYDLYDRIEGILII